MYNDDLKRFYPQGGDKSDANDFMRYDQKGKFPAVAIGSGTASEGSILEADGAGGVNWSDALVTKLDKQTTTSTLAAYTVDSDGNNSVTTVDVGTQADSIVQRNADGQLNCESPTKTKNAANKGYVDGRLCSHIITLTSDGAFGWSIVKISISIICKDTTTIDSLSKLLSLLKLSIGNGGIWNAVLSYVESSVSPSSRTRRVQCWYGHSEGGDYVDEGYGAVTYDSDNDHLLLLVGGKSNAANVEDITAEDALHTFTITDLVTTLA